MHQLRVDRQRRREHEQAEEDYAHECGKARRDQQLGHPHLRLFVFAHMRAGSVRGDGESDDEQEREGAGEMVEVEAG